VRAVRVLLFRLKLKGPGVHTTPSRAVWPVAATNGLASLVPAEEAQIYNRLDFEAVAAMHSDDLSEVALTKADAVSSCLGVPFNPGDHVHLKQATSRNSSGPRRKQSN